MQKYDLVVCNPPYFEDHLRSKDHRKSLARHNLRLSLKELAEIIPYLLQDNGWFYTILPNSSFERLKAQLQVLGFTLNDRLEIYIGPEKPVYRIIGGFGRLRATPRHKRLLIYDDKGEYTHAFKTILKDYYLAF
jgi:tRNA1Val (adenine37-N6)-methyltransferase